MLPDRVSNPGPQTYKSSALLIVLHGPAPDINDGMYIYVYFLKVVIHHPPQHQFYHLTNTPDPISNGEFNIL